MKSNPPRSQSTAWEPTNELEALEQDHDLETLGNVEILETDNLDETVLGAAAVGIPEHMPPELIAGTENLTDWDESEEVTGRRTPIFGADDGMVDVERLVEAGVEEADRERRVAAGDDLDELR